jgi:hypothetical protein
MGDWIPTGDIHVAYLHDQHVRKIGAVLLVNLGRWKGKRLSALDIIDPDNSIIYTAVLHSHQIDLASFPADIDILCDLNPLGWRRHSLELNSALNYASR